ncbi:MAG: hypothetical protein U0903_03360 [Planctomycetales bacterium]
MPDSTVELQAGDIIIADSLFRSSAPKPPARPASWVSNGPLSIAMVLPKSRWSTWPWWG